MLNTITITTLSIGLIAVIGFFLHTEYRATPIITHTDLNHPPTNTLEAPITHTSATTTLQSPDTFLPIPAQQLKKVMETSVSEEATLDAKIALANQSIADIEQQLGQVPTASPDKTDNTHKTQKRLQHLRDYLEKNAPSTSHNTPKPLPLL